MKLTALGAGVLLSFVIFSINTEKVSAETINVATLAPITQSADKLAVLDIVEDVLKPQTEAVEANKPEVIRHIVAENETLTKVAETYQTTWVRLFNKNTHIENPDVLQVGTELVIPASDEQLAERELPVVAPKQPIAAVSQKTATTSVRVARGGSAGNTYTWGYCTWYVKNRRPDLPNNLGNAYTWVSRAAAQGIHTGSAPRAGAVGQRGNHVVYVESVNGDGTVTISEMNHKGVGIKTVRTVPADYFIYIY